MKGPRAQPDGPVCGFALASFGATRRLAYSLGVLRRCGDKRHTLG